MTEKRITRISLDELVRKKKRGETRVNPDAPEGPALGEEFWKNAVIEGPRRTRPVHLKLDSEVFQHFFDETGGKGHISRMQAVLKAYVNAQKATLEKSKVDKR